MYQPDIKVKKSQVRPLVQASFPDYRGRTFKVQFSETVTFADTNWGGGTRSQFRFLDMSNGKSAPLSVPAPWANNVEGKTVDLPEHIVVVEHIIFCGKDLGLRFHAHPNRNRMLGVK